MFGYISINQKELSEESFSTYQSFYCGLCHQLREDFGNRGRVLLSYDMTFLVVLLTALYETKTDAWEFNCAIHPVKKRWACRNEITEYAAAMNVILAYHNLEDDWKDDHSFTKHTIAAFLQKDYEKVAGEYPRQVKAVETYMQKQAAAELRQETNLDMISGLTGEMLGELFAWKQDEWYHELKTLGYHMGKFIYMMDAYEDLDKDEKHNQYNPLEAVRRNHPQEFEHLCQMILTSMIAESAKAFERLPILIYVDILRNIFYSGVWTKYEMIQIQKKNKQGEDEHDRSISGSRD